MSDIDLIVYFIIKLFIIINAKRLGWHVELFPDKIILQKKIKKLTKLDKNTPKLINELIKTH